MPIKIKRKADDLVDPGSLGDKIKKRREKQKADIDALFPPAKKKSKARAKAKPKPRISRKKK